MMMTVLITWSLPLAAGGAGDLCWPSLAPPLDTGPRVLSPDPPPDAAPCTNIFLQCCQIFSPVVTAATCEAARRESRSAGPRLSAPCCCLLASSASTCSRRSPENMTVAVTDQYQYNPSYRGWALPWLAWAWLSSSPRSWTPGPRPPRGRGRGRRGAWAGRAHYSLY